MGDGGRSIDFLVSERVRSRFGHSRSFPFLSGVFVLRKQKKWVNYSLIIPVGDLYRIFIVNEWLYTEQSRDKIYLSPMNFQRLVLFSVFSFVLSGQVFLP